MERQLLVYALPVFAFAMILDYLLDLFRKTGRYRISDSIASLGAGFLGTTSGVLSAGVAGFFYLGVFNWFHVFEIGNSWMAWVIAAVVYDFFYYFYHRAHHRVNILWASHATHHNSEHFNFTTALRQSSLVFLTTWPFFIPMAFLGFSFEQYLFAAALSVIYGFFTHTELFSYWPYLETVLVGPSSHRVHHGINARYVDRNYGSILNVWDRLMGTYARELKEDPVVFGTLTPLNSSNPFWANFAVYVSLARDAWRATSGWDRVAIWFRETGWRPTELGPSKVPTSEEVLSRGRARFGRALQTSELLYVGFHFVLLALGTGLVMTGASHHSLLENLNSIAIVWLGLASLGMILDQRKWAFQFEWVRLVLTTILLIFNPSVPWSGFLFPHLPFLLAGFVVNGIVFFYAWRFRMTMR